MKPLFFVACLLLGAHFSNAGTPPEAVTKAFQKMFPNATNVKWGSNNKDWKASFTVSNANTVADFAEDGKWIETETNIPVAQLPAKVSAAIKSADPGAEISNAKKVDTAANGTLYNAYVKANGKGKEVSYTFDGVLSKSHDTTMAKPATTTSTQPKEKVMPATKPQTTSTTTTSAKPTPAPAPKKN